MKDKDTILARIKKLISNKNPKDNKQAKKLGMRKNIKLKDLRKEFCQGCYHPLNGKVRINKGYKVIQCKNCGIIHRFKIS